MSKIVAIDHAVLTLRLTGNPTARILSQAQLEAMPEADFDAYIADVGDKFGSHNRLEINEVLRRKTAKGWQLFQTMPLRTGFNDDRAPVSATTEYIFVMYEDTPAKSKKDA